MPGGGHAADDRGADQDHRERAVLRRCKHAHDALVAREEVRHAARGNRVHGEECARHVDHAHEPAVTGHVQAVIIPGRQVEVREVAVPELGRQPRVPADQPGRCEAMTLGLQEPGVWQEELRALFEGAGSTKGGTA